MWAESSSRCRNDASSALSRSLTCLTILRVKLFPALLVILAWLLFSGCGVRSAGDLQRGPPEAEARWPEPVRYDLDLRYEPRRFRLRGTQAITLRNTGPRTLDTVWLRLWANAFGSCRRRYATVTVTAGARRGAERVGCTALQLKLDEPLARGAEATIRLDLTLTAPPRADRTGRYGGGSYFGNAIPLLAVEDRGGVHLEPYTFAGESFFSLAAPWHAKLALPRGQVAATTGQARRTTGGLEVDVPLARDFTIVAGPFRVAESRAAGVKLRHFRRRGTAAAESTKVLRVAARSLRAYNRWFGPYGGTELDLVEGPRRIAQTGIAMEYPELVLTTDEAFAVAHEVAHQWFWHIVGNDQWLNPWLDESTANYATLRLLGGLPKPSSVSRCRQQAHPKVPLSASMAVFDRRGDIYGDVVYSRGACTWGVLEREWGAARLLRTLRRYVAAHRYGAVSQADLLAALRDGAPPASGSGVSCATPESAQSRAPAWRPTTRPNLSRAGLRGSYGPPIPVSTENSRVGPGLTVT